MARHLLGLGLVFALVACGGSGKLKRLDRKQPNLAFPAGESAPVKADVDGVLTASLDPNAATTQVVKASGDSPISNASLAFPPGALAIAVDITIKAGSESFSGDLATELGLEGESAVIGGSVPVQIDASQVVSLAQPFVLAMDLPVQSGLQSAGFDNLALIYQIRNEAEGRLESGLVPRDELTVQDGQALYSSFHFGWFRLVLLNSPVTERRVVTDSKARANVGLMLLQSATQLPACGATDVGVTVYLKAETKFKTCTASGWEDISLTGPKGDAGAAGPQGPAGNFVMRDASGAKVGDLLGFTYLEYSVPTAPIIALSDGSHFSLSYKGDFSGICATGPCEQTTYDFTYATMVRPTCFYGAANCAGDCYIKHQTKGTLARSATAAAPTTYSYWKATKSETNNFALANSLSYWDAVSGTCRAAGVSIPLGTPLASFTWPAGYKAPPYQTPLSIGK